MREREELEPVTDEGTLRVGDLCVLKACRLCGGRHRFMLLRCTGVFDRCLRDGVVVQIRPQRAWEVYPRSECDQRSSHEVFDGPLSDRRLFRVRTGIESEITGAVPAELTA